MRARELSFRARASGLLGIELNDPSGLPQLVVEPGREKSGGRLGDQLIAAMRAAVAADLDDGADQEGAVVAAAIRLTEVMSAPTQAPPAEFRAAYSGLLDALVPFTAEAGTWDANSRRVAVSTAARLWIRSWADRRAGVTTC